MRGIAEQGDAAERPARQRIAIDHRVFQDGVGGADPPGTSSQSKFQFAKRGRKSASLPGRFQSSRGSMAPSPMCRSQIQLISASPLSAWARLIGIADELLVVMAGLHHAWRRPGTACPR